ncbi:hypothetical protein EBT31_07620 [bacterium]|nr:hypothetical protein [bacterium]
MDARQETRALLNALDDNDQAKVASSRMTTLIKDRLRESSVADRILVPEKVSADQLIPSTQHDTMVKLVEMEPTARATVLTFRGQPDAQFMRGKRVAVGFWTISSLRQETTDMELLSYGYSLTKVVEDLSIKEMFEMKDLVFIGYVNTAVDYMQDEANGSSVGYNSTAVREGTVISASKLKGAVALARTTDDFAVGAIQKIDFVNIKTLLAEVIVGSAGTNVRSGRLEAEVMLINSVDAERIALWTTDVAGQQIAGNTTEKGFTGSVTVGLRMIKTIKTDIITRGNVYVFTKQDFFGVSYLLNDMKFFIKKEGRRICWEAWMDVGMALVNIASVVKLELYSGSTTSGQTDTGYAVAVPIARNQMGGVNHKLEEGLMTPSVEMY